MYLPFDWWLTYILVMSSHKLFRCIYLCKPFCYDRLWYIFLSSRSLLFYMVARKKDLLALGKFNFRCIRDTATRYQLSLHIRQTDINSSLRFIHTCLCLFYSTFEHSKVQKMHNQTCLQQLNFRVTLNYLFLNHINREHFVKLWFKLSGN